MKYLITGLGNIGKEYEFTRHNIGFEVVDYVAKKLNGSFTEEKLGSLCLVKHKGRSIYLLKPNTYMNLSGKAVRYWMQELKISVENALIITDDLSLPLGKIRFRPKGSAGGHNGLKSVEALLGTDAYPRLKVGVGDDFNKGNQVDYVLGKFDSTEEETVQDVCIKSVEAVLSFTSIGLALTMNKFN